MFNQLKDTAGNRTGKCIAAESRGVVFIELRNVTGLFNKQRGDFGDPAAQRLGKQVIICIDTCGGEKGTGPSKATLDLVGNQREFPVFELPHQSIGRLGNSAFPSDGLINGGNDRGKAFFALDYLALLLGQRRKSEIVGREE